MFLPLPAPFGATSSCAVPSQVCGQEGAVSTLLRLAEFLPSPGVAAFGAQTVPVEAAPPSWQSYSALAMPPVPPLPVMCTSAVSQPPLGVSFHYQDSMGDALHDGRPLAVPGTMPG